MVLDNVSALGAHQCFRIYLTGADGSLDARLCRVIKTYPTCLEDLIYETLDLYSQSLLGG